MRLIGAIIIFAVIYLCGCDHSSRGVSFSTMKFNCRYTENPIGIQQPYFDTLRLFISKSQPDLISFKETEFTDECIHKIESEGYKFIPVNMLNDSGLSSVSPVAIKKTSFEFLASSYYTYKNDTLEGGKNRVSWYQLKNNSSGHIFYLFRLELQKQLNTYQSQLIAYDLLKRIDQISSGVPVILMGDFYNSNSAVKELLTYKWKNIYPLNEVKNANRNSDFLVNDFLKIKGSYADGSNDSLINNVVIRFALSTGRISKSKKGETIPE